MNGQKHSLSDTDIYDAILTPLYGHFPIIGRLYPSPFRPDEKRPSFRLTEYKGVLYWEDFGRDDEERSAKGLQYLLGIDSITLPRDREAVRLRYAEVKTVGVRANRHLGREEIAWWGEYGVSHKTLRRYDVRSCVSLWCGNWMVCASYPEAPAFCYVFGERSWQVYRPEVKDGEIIREEKLLWHKGIRDKLMGYDQLPYGGRSLIIGAGMKDILPLAEMGLNVAAPFGEGETKVWDIYLPELRQRFQHIYAAMDNDLPGELAEAKLQKRGIKVLNMKWNNLKDAADMSKQSSPAKVREAIEQRVWELYRAEI